MKIKIGSEDAVRHIFSLDNGVDSHENDLIETERLVYNSAGFELTRQKNA